ncbi:MAG TPA: chemotaxis protein CheB [Candidatus Binatia bacterium]|nr:chemotaxis protein CheB [Candidatus Binatia bacterium]
MISADELSPPAAVHPVHVVAIGASAGGVAGIRTVVSALPASLPAAVLIVLHSSPRHESLLPFLLGRHTTLAVKQAAHGEALAAGAVYVAPSDQHLLVRHGRLELSRSRLVQFSRPSIDLLFESVAVEYGPGALAVILTGEGVDGALGILAVKRTGGRTIAQDPTGVTHRSMPQAAIDTGCVDAVLPLHQIGPAIARLVRGQPSTDAA